MLFASFIDLLTRHPRRVFLGIALWCLALLSFGLYLQHVNGLEPCPMCIVQRYAMMLVAIMAGVLALFKHPQVHRWGGLGLVLVAAFGAFTAARQSWLQWFPPEIFTCGRGFYGMIESFPLRQVIPMIFRGTGDCAQSDWAFLGLTIPNWSFLNFVAMGALALAVVLLQWRAKPKPHLP